MAMVRYIAILAALIGCAGAQFDGYWFRTTNIDGVPAMTSVDVDGDGARDLIVADDEVSANLWTFLNDGNGTMTGGPIQAGVGIPAFSGVGIGDMNGDGALDFVGACMGSSNCYIVVIDSTGTYTFNPIPLLVGTPGMALGDVDGDGDLDVYHLTVSDSNLNTFAGVMVFTNDGTGTLSLHGSFPALGVTAPTGMYGLTLNDLVVSDFDGDGDDDAAVVNGSMNYVDPTGFPPLASVEANAVTILLSDGAGNLTLTSTLTTSATPRDLECADLDGDGDLDLVVACFGAVPTDNGAVNVFLNDGSGGFPVTMTHQAEFHPRRIIIGDVDGDGLDDLVTRTWNTPFFSSTLTVDQVTVLTNMGAANFGAPQSQAIPLAGTTRIIGDDFDGDGCLDLALAAWQRLAIWSGGPRTFALYPGSNDDLVLGTGVDGPVTSTPPDDVKVASIGSALTACVTSPNGTFAGDTMWLLVRFVGANHPPTPLPGTTDAYIHPFSNSSYVINSPALAPGGECDTQQIPFWAFGRNYLFQAYALSSSAANGFYAATDAHLISVQ